MHISLRDKDKVLLKKAVISVSPIIRLLIPNNRPFLCIITPVFDGCLEAVTGLISDLEKQTSQSYVHILVSNGESPLIKSYIQDQPNERLIYAELPYEPHPTGIELQENLGKRRNLAMKNFKADRYIFIDADTQIINERYIEQLFAAHVCIRKDIIMTQSLVNGVVFPLIPINIGRMDMTNMTFSHTIAMTHDFPTDVIPEYRYISDYRFFLIINKPHNTAFMPIMGCVKDARRSYESVKEFFERTVELV